MLLAGKKSVVKTSVRWGLVSDKAVFASDVIVARLALSSSLVCAFLTLSPLFFHASHVAQPLAVLALAAATATAHH